MGHRLDLAEGVGPFDYPALIPDGDGVAATWSWHRDAIAFQRLGRAELGLDPA